LRVYTLRVHLVRGPWGREQEGLEIFRTLKVRGDQTLEDLHGVILCSFDREQERGGGYAFFVPDEGWGPERVKYRCTEGRGTSTVPGQGAAGAPLSGFATLDSLHLGPETLLAYRFGTADPWDHVIRVAGVGPAIPSEEYPLLVEKAGSPPTPRKGPGAPGHGAPEPTACAPPERHRGEILALLLRETQPSERRQWERVSLRPNTRLKTAVGGLPFHWLDGVCQLLGMKRAGSRKAREEKLVRTLPGESTLEGIWSFLPASARELLVWMLRERGGWATVRQVSLRFGRAAEFGCWWLEERIPPGALTIVRLYGLVYVGGNVSGRGKARIATVPVELRRPLKKIADTPGSHNPPPVLGDLFPEGASAPDPAPAPARVILASRVPMKVRWKDLRELDVAGFLRDCPLDRETERFYAYMVGRIRRDPEGFPREDVRALLREMIRGSAAWNRLAAYKLGTAMFGRPFARPAVKDGSAKIRRWAAELFDPRQEELF